MQQIDRQQPGSTERQRQQHPCEKTQGVAAAFFRERQRDHDQRHQHQYRQQTGGQEGRRQRHTENRHGQLRSARQQGKRPVNRRMRHQYRQHRLRFVRVVEETDAAGERQWRTGGEVLAVQFTCRQQDELQRQQGAQTAGQTRPFMHRQQPGEQFGEEGGNPVVERRVRVRLAGQMGKQPVAAGKHFENDTDGDRVVVLPGVVADQPGEDVEREQERQRPAAGGQGNSSETW